MNYEIRGVREGDLPYLAAHLRAADARELVATYGNAGFLDALNQSAVNSHEVAVCEGDGVPMVLWGLHRLNPTSGLIWCCATPLVTKFRLAFVRESRAIIQRWFDETPSLQTLFNYSHTANTLHHRWLRSCGATVLPEVPMGPFGEPFSPFVIRRNPCVTSA
ncbi:hypothetical protein ASG03_10125 [Rhizobium sp. Leaf341]|nr:hypothetical protein ASG03_10125 [Rhizobium sp. Leaf341]